MFETLALLIVGSDDANAVKKTIQDTNLSLRIKDISFEEKSEEVMKAVQDKLANMQEQSEEYKGFYHLLQWLSYSVEYYFFGFEKKSQDREMKESKFKTFTNLAGLQMEEKIDEIEMQAQQIQQKIETEQHLMSDTEFKLNQCDLILKRYPKFELLQQFMSECDSLREGLVKQQRFCLESSIYFTLKLTFLFACGNSYDQTEPMLKSREGASLLTETIEKLFLRWCFEQNGSVELSFFQRQTHQIFANKEKFYFIDRELQGSEFSLIQKCKKIGEMAGWQMGGTRELMQLDRYVPESLLSRFVYLGYLLKSKNEQTKILIQDKYENFKKYLGLKKEHRVWLEENTSKLLAKSQDKQLLGAYKLFPNYSSLLPIDSFVYFIELPEDTAYIALRELKKGPKTAGGFMLKINAREYFLTESESLKVVFLSPNDLRWSSSLHQFYLFSLDENVGDVREIVSNTIVQHESAYGFVLAFLRGACRVSVGEESMRKIVMSRQRNRFLWHLIDVEGKYKQEFIWKSFIGKKRQKLLNIPIQEFRDIIGRLEKWKASYDEMKTVKMVVEGLNEFGQKYISKYLERIIDIFGICLRLEEKMRKQKQYLLEGSHHGQVSFVVKLTREGMVYASAIKKQSQICGHLTQTVKYILNYYCFWHRFKDLNTFCLFLKVYSLQTSQASGFQVLNLLHCFNKQKALQMLTEHRTQSLNQAFLADLPVYKLQIEKFLKTLRDIRSGKGEAASFFKSKNMLFNPSHIEELIELFEFKILKRDCSEDQRAKEEFKKLSQFTKLFLRRLLVPDLFFDESWRLAAKWRSGVLEEGVKNLYLQGKCFIFCEVSFWSGLITKNELPEVQYIKISEVEQEQQLCGLEKRASEEEEGRLIVMIDERSWKTDQKECIKNRQRLMEYISIKRKGLIIVLGKSYHELFHQMMREQQKDAKAAKYDEIYCLQINEIMFLLQYTSKHLKKQEAQGYDKLQCQKAMLLPSLSQFYDENQHILINLMLSQLSEGDYVSSNQRIKARLSLWQPFTRYRLSLPFSFKMPESFNKKGHPLNAQVAFASIEERGRADRDHFSAIMEYLTKNRTAITAYLKNRLNSHKGFRSSVFKELSENKRQVEESEEIQFRFALKFQGEELKVEQNIIESSTHRIHSAARKRVSNQFQKLLAQNYQLQEYVATRVGVLVQHIEEGVQKIMQLWRVYQGQVVFGDYFQRIACGQVEDLKVQIISKNDEIFKMMAQFQELMLMRDAQRFEVVFTPSSLDVIYNYLHGAGLVNLSYHQSIRRQSEVILKCSEEDTCGCAELSKHRGSQKLLVLINNRLYEVCLNGAMIAVRERPVRIVLRLQGTIVMAAVYCDRILRELL